MTQEEKAQRYDEALERAKDFMNGEAHYELKMGENIMCWVFPELRESEDERIRKELIAFIKKRDRSGCDYDYDQWIAWLEKQGEERKITHEEICKS